MQLSAARCLWAGDTCRHKGGRHLWMLAGDPGACHLVGGRNQTPWLANSIFLTHWGYMGNEFGHAGCFRRGQDIVVPPVIDWTKYDHAARHDASGAEVALSEEWRSQWVWPNATAAPRTTILFFSGSAGQNPGCEHPAVLRYHENTTGFNIRGDRRKVGSKEYMAFMRSSVFCLVAPGAGWAVRSYHAVLHGCIPVFIPDNIAPALDEVIPWNQLSVTVAKEDIPKLDQILNDISKERIREMQEGLACAWPRMHMGSFYGAYADEDVRHDMFDSVMQVLRNRMSSGEQGSPLVDGSWRGVTSTCKARGFHSDRKK
eukprot:gene8440-10031_t